MDIDRQMDQPRGTHAFKRSISRVVPLTTALDLTRWTHKRVARVRTKHSKILPRQQQNMELLLGGSRYLLYCEREIYYVCCTCSFRSEVFTTALVGSPD